MGEPELGRGGRLTGFAAPELVEGAYAHEARHAPRLAQALSLSDLAHAVVLVESSSLDRDAGAALLGGLLDLHDIPGEKFPWNPELGDAFNSREAELRRRVGAAASGWLSAGRPRREALRVALRRTARIGALRLAEAELDLADALTEHAERLADQLATDYTYLQPAQPSTVGHMMLAYVYPLLRDAGRLRHLDEWFGASPAGVGGSAGSRWPLDRARLAELLGFDSVARHTRDAMWQADGYADLAGAVAIATTHQSQFAQDLEILASQEFSIVRLADRHSRASALMPQKRNPYALAAIRAQAAVAAGEVAAIHVALHTGSARTDHFHVLNGAVPRLLDEAIATTRLTAGVAAGLSIDSARWGAAARRGGTAAADVADLLAQSTRLDYRTAHTIVGRAVRELSEEGLPLDALTPEALRRAAQDVWDGDLTISGEALDAALDPALLVVARFQSGSTAAGEVAAMIAECRDDSRGLRAWASGVNERLGASEEALLARAAEHAGSG